MSATTMTKRLLLASTSIAGVVLLASPAMAQGISPATAADEEDTSTIVVTGSRIPQPNLDSASPVTVVSPLEIKQSGTTRVEDLLNALPQVFAGQGGNVSNGATGTATVDLRNLGPERTLVLINGRRLVPGDPRDPVGDINIIPAAVIKRVDVLTGGASSVYGADAVSGVVNFVMDTDFEGFKLDGQYSFYNHNNRTNAGVLSALNARGFGFPDGVVTDGGAIDVTAVFGVGFDDGRGHITAYGGYRKIDPVTQDRRDYSACSLTGLPATSTNPATATVANRGRLYDCGGSVTSFPGTFYTPATGYLTLSGNTFVPGTVLYNFAPTNYFQRPDERYTAGFFANYEVSEAIKPYMEFMFMDDRTVAQIAPTGNFFNTSTINCDNPLLSAQQFGIACAPGNLVRDDPQDPTSPVTLFPAAGGGTFTKGNLYVGRRNVEGGGRQDDLQHTTFRGVIGSKGEFGDGFSYDAFYQYGRVNFAQTYRNDFSVSRLSKALDVVSVGGVPTCRSVVDGTDPACVPYNVFVEGGVTGAALNYLQVPLLSRGQSTQQIFNASVTFVGTNYGVVSPFATDGVGINVGFEYRKETLNFEVDSNFLSGDGAGQGGPTTPIAGKQDIKEFFAEVSIPLVQDAPFFEDLRIGGGYRRSSYDQAGLDPATGLPSTNSFSTDTYKIEGSWQPVRDIKFRASYNRAVRAPNLVELYGSRAFGLSGSADPCGGPSTVANDPNTPANEATTGTVNGNTFAQCALTGATAATFGSIATNPANQYNGYLGGTAQLQPEISDSITAGAVFTPTFIPGFQASVDYFNIKLKQQIGPFGFDAIISTCLSTGDPFFCGLIFRRANGTLQRGTPSFATGGYIFDVNANAGRLTTTGIDVTVSYSRDIGDLGNLGFSLSGTYLDELEIDDVGPRAFNCAGYFGSQCGTPSPKWRHKARISYTAPSGPGLSVAWRYFDSVDNDTQSPDTDLNRPLFTGARPGNRFIASQSYFDLAVTLPVGDKFTARFGANNILDKEPPLNGQGLGGSNGNTFSQVYDALGRYLYFGVTLDL